MGFGWFLFGAGVGISIVFIVKFIRRESKKYDDLLLKREKLMQKYFPAKVYKDFKIEESFNHLN